MIYTIEYIIIIQLRPAGINYRQNSSASGCKRDARSFWWGGSVGSVLTKPINLHCSVDVLIAMLPRPPASKTLALLEALGLQLFHGARLNIIEKSPHSQLELFPNIWG